MRRTFLIGGAMLLIAFWLAACVIPKVHRQETINGTLTGHAVTAPVSIIYDRQGMPHIRAANDSDLFYGLGYAMAQDRFFLLDLYRRVGRGELSGLIGPLPAFGSYDLLAVDRIMRSLRFVDRGRDGVAQLTPEDRALLEAFTRGINHYLADAGDSLVEYRFFKTKPEPWRPEDCFVNADVFGLSMTLYGLVYEYYATRLVEEIGAERAKTFLVEYPKDAPYITQEKLADAANGPALDRLFAALGPVLPMLNGIGSNNWVVSGQKTASGKPLLANDPHIPTIINPTFWYHVHLQGGSYDVAGFMFPGFPAFGTGTNGKIAWGITNARADYFDLYREKIGVKKHPGQYYYQGEWRYFEVKREQIPVRGRQPVAAEIRYTVHGPVLEKSLLGWDVPVNSNQTVLVAHLNEVDMARFFHGYNRIALAGNWAEFTAALEDKAMGPVAWNHVFASASGDIGYYESGHVALRPDGQGILARRGTGEDDWTGWIPFAEMPHVLNPEKGFIVSANNKVEGPDYPHYLSAGYMHPSRASRITELLQDRTGLTVKDMESIQFDVKVKSAEKIVPLILADLATDPNPTIQKMLADLRAWQGQGYFATVDAIGPPIYETALKHLIRETFADELGETLVGRLGTAGMDFPTLLKIVDDPNNVWFDDIATGKAETRPEIMRRALLDSHAYLEEKLGTDPRQWTWGRLQTLYLYLPLGIIPKAGKPYRIGKYEYPGTEETVNNSTPLFIGRIGFMHLGGPTSRFVVDMSDPRRFYFNSSTGNSENIGGGRLAQTTEAWRGGDYFVMSLEEADYREGMMGELQLTP